MAKGVAIKLISYEETIPKVLKLIKFDKELKKHEKIVLKPNLIPGFPELSTKPEFLSPILKFCMENKNPGTEILIAEGCDGQETSEVFDEFGYTRLAEKYGVGLIDLNNTETDEIENSEFLRFTTIKYPTILKESFIISVPQLGKHGELGIAASLDNMLGAFPSKHYKGFFSSTKNKLSKYPLKYQIHDILKCKMPDFAIIDANEIGNLLIGQPLEMDKQASTALGLNWRNVQHLRLIDESITEKTKKEEEVDSIIKESN
ncbi:MAG: DUF362 domain-containing protein [Candidatus Pacearchaeota archaeon]|nr:DUF362 domain-containing protein [Candidatus Pacearchaeota archaeon]